MGETIEVAPFAGAWIEILNILTKILQERVAPFAGAWIEIVIPRTTSPDKLSRSLRGSVD